MHFVQIALLLLIGSTQVFRPNAISEWERFGRSKLWLLASLSTNVFFYFIAKMTVDRPMDSATFAVLSWQGALTSLFVVLSAGFYLFSLRVPQPSPSAMTVRPKRPVVAPPGVLPRATHSASSPQTPNT